MSYDMHGDVNGDAPAIGVIDYPYQVSEPFRLTGHLSIPEYVGKTYDGPYEVTPASDFQLLPTADRVLEDDILVHPIPYSEVSNEQGGITVTIGE